MRVLECHQFRQRRVRANRLARETILSDNVSIHVCWFQGFVLDKKEKKKKKTGLGHLLCKVLNEYTITE